MTGCGLGRRSHHPATAAKKINTMSETSGAHAGAGASRSSPRHRSSLFGNPGYGPRRDVAVRPMQLQGKTFVVTGGSSGLGAACVREFARAGANIVICDVRRGNELARELGAAVRFARTDVTDSAQVQSAVSLRRKTFGALHGAINCAGIATAERVMGREGPLFPESAFRRSAQVKFDRYVQRHSIGGGKNDRTPGRTARGSRRHHLHRIGSRLRRADRSGRLCSLERRRRGAHASGGAQVRAKHQIHVDEHRAGNLRHADAGRLARTRARVVG